MIFRYTKSPVMFGDHQHHTVWWKGIEKVNSIPLYNGVNSCGNLYDEFTLISVEVEAMCK